MKQLRCHLSYQPLTLDQKLCKGLVVKIAIQCNATPVAQDDLINFTLASQFIFDHIVIVSNYLSGDLVVRWSELESNLLGESGKGIL